MLRVDGEHNMVPIQPTQKSHLCHELENFFLFYISDDKLQLTYLHQ